MIDGPALGCRINKVRPPRPLTLMVAALTLVALTATGSLASDPSDSIIGTDDLYGFTSGSDIGDAGARIVGVGTTWALGKRGGRFGAGATNFEFRYNISDDLQVGVGTNVDSFSIRDVPGLANREFSGFGGVTPALRWRLIERSLSPGHPETGGSPIGLTLSLEPGIGLFDGATGDRVRTTALETRLALDGALVPQHLYGALNVSYEAERTQPRGLGSSNAVRDAAESAGTDPGGVTRSDTRRESTLGLSGALTYQVVTDYFVGGEIRYRRAYEGLGLQSLAGQALFIGPTFFTDLGNEKSLAIAWSSQVTGKAQRGRGGLDLNNFSRHESRIAFRVGF